MNKSYWKIKWIAYIHGWYLKRLMIRHHGLSSQLQWLIWVLIFLLWIKWRIAFLLSNPFIVLINDSPSDIIVPSRGLGQGNSLFFIFVYFMWGIFASNFKILKFNLFAFLFLKWPLVIFSSQFFNLLVIYSFSQKFLGKEPNSMLKFFVLASCLSTSNGQDASIKSSMIQKVF